MILFFSSFALNDFLWRPRLTNLPFLFPLRLIILRDCGLVHSWQSTTWWNTAVVSTVRSSIRATPRFACTEDCQPSPRPTHSTSPSSRRVIRPLRRAPAAPCSYPAPLPRRLASKPTFLADSWGASCLLVCSRTLPFGKTAAAAEEELMVNMAAGQATIR